MVLDSETICRITLGLIFSGAVCIGLPYRVRADRAGGRVSLRVDPRWFWWLMAVIVPPLVVTCAAFVLQPRWVAVAQADLPAWLRLAGAPVALAGLALLRAMFLHLGLNVTSTSAPREHATLVFTGPYRRIRHPMYAAVLILVAATTLLTANIIVAGGGFAMFLLLAARSRLEERRLVEKFGDAYRSYQARTGRYFPRLIP